VIVDDNQFTAIVNLFIMDLASKVASRFSNTTEGDVVERHLFIEITGKGGTGFRGAIVGSHVKNICIKVDDPRAGSRLELSHDN
jgi:hypothetical protein